MMIWKYMRGPHTSSSRNYVPKWFDIHGHSDLNNWGKANTVLVAKSNALSPFTSLPEAKEKNRVAMVARVYVRKDSC